MYVLTPEIALMLKRNELVDEMALEAVDILDHIEHMTQWDELGFTISDEPTDLASEIEPSVFNKYMPNDGTPRIEHRLRRQGLRKASDDKREEVQDLHVEVWSLQRRAQRLHILRQRSGDMLLAV